MEADGNEPAIGPSVAEENCLAVLPLLLGFFEVRSFGQAIFVAYYPDVLPVGVRSLVVQQAAGELAPHAVLAQPLVVEPELTLTRQHRSSSDATLLRPSPSLTRFRANQFGGDEFVSNLAHRPGCDETAGPFPEVWNAWLRDRCCALRRE